MPFTSFNPTNPRTNFYYYDGLQPKMSAGIINEHDCMILFLMINKLSKFSRFCTAQDNYIKFKKEESLAEAAETVRLEQKCLRSSSLDYVYLMHVVQERKKFEFVEALLSFMHSWSNYYRFGHEKTETSAGYMNDLKSR